MTATPENPVLRKTIATHGSEKFIASCPINLDSGVSHVAKTEYYYFYQKRPSDNRHKICVFIALFPGSKRY
jgi:hypothetical protein